MSPVNFFVIDDTLSPAPAVALLNAARLENRLEGGRPRPLRPTAIMTSPPSTTTSVMADLARRVAAIGWGAPVDPKPGYAACTLCSHPIVEGRPVFMLHDKPYCCSAHRIEAYTDDGNLLQRRAAPSLARTASKWACAETSASGEWHAFHVCD